MSIKYCPDCGSEMLYLPKGDCTSGECKFVGYVWICTKCGKEIKSD